MHVCTNNVIVQHLEQAPEWCKSLHPPYMYIILYFSSEFLGWVDEVYQNQAHDDIITLSVQKGGSVILECSPNTTESLEGLTPTWVPQNKTSVHLSSGSVLMTDVEEDANLVCFWVLRQNVVRQFYVKVTGKHMHVVLCLVMMCVDEVDNCRSVGKFQRISEDPRKSFPGTPVIIHEC